MPYDSVDKLQKVMTKRFFQHATDKKKACGRALGTIVEIITFYLLKSWDLNDSVSIERKIPEYGLPEITHNVEYSLHPIYDEYITSINKDGKTITSTKILSKVKSDGILKDIEQFEKIGNELLTSKDVLRNACIIAQSEKSYLIATMNKIQKNNYEIKIVEQSFKPYSIVECKRVGVEEGMKKGPQTIEKAKQGAYVARTISSLQKTRLKDGRIFGTIYLENDKTITKPYADLLREFIHTDNQEYLRDFVLTVGVVSNHGNWFTSDNPNKEMKVLSHSYDWLLFLEDTGITEFVEETILKPSEKYKNIKMAFKSSYCKNKKSNQFTKVQMNLKADIELNNYFDKNIDKIENWFNIITPKKEKLTTLKNEIYLLKNKNWKDIHK